MTTYTNVNKPSGTTYSNRNAIGGKEQYDQSDLTYDSAFTYYDGINPTQYTSVTKPVSTTYTNVAKPT